MEIFFGVIFACVAMLAILLLRSLTTLFHELGHALPALQFSSGEVVVYIGTYGDVSNSFQWQSGRLRIYFRINMLDWKIGMCQHQGIENWWHRFWVIIGGPTASLLLSIPLLLWMVYGGLSTVGIVVLSIFILAATLDFFVNIIPFSSSITMHDGSATYNDGYQLIQLIARRNLSPAYLKLEQKFLEGQYEEVIEEGSGMLSDGAKEPIIYTLIVRSLIEEKRLNDALDLYREIKQQFELNDEDYFLIGCIYNQQEKFEEALKYFEHYFYKNFQDARVLNEMGYAKIYLERYPEALRDLKAAHQYAPDLEAPLLNLALLHLRNDYLEAAAKFLRLAAQRNTESPLLAYYCGMLYEKRRDYDKAVEYYRKAKSLNLEKHGLDYKIETLGR
ncbi:MAG: tetratricopeptide repeat protein [Bacteroidota bacterium]